MRTPLRSIHAENRLLAALPSGRLPAFVGPRIGRRSIGFRHSIRACIIGHGARRAAVVQGQLDALAKDDAAKAFSFAAPNVREAFRTAPRFLDMVQRGYPVVYRPASVAFLKVEGKDRLAFQRVQMTDQAGEPWLATYSLERQKNGQWRITGCSVVENRGRMT
jgi:Domain of unknown function (DUF4864)